MTSITLAEAQSQFAALITRAQAGETITCDGETIATLAPPQSLRQPIDIEALRAATARIRPQPIGAGDFVRAMRDSERY